MMVFSIRINTYRRKRLLEAYASIRHSIGHAFIMSGFSKQELADKTGISGRKIDSIMSYGRIPTFPELVLLADALDLEIILASNVSDPDRI
jgi:transcriptional regulator with XRE-family HTH domain